MPHLAQTHLVKNSFFTSDLILSISLRPLVLLASRQQKYRWDNKQYDCYIETLDSVNIAGKHSQKSPSSVSSVCVVWHRLTFLRIHKWIIKSCRSVVVHTGSVSQSKRPLPDVFALLSGTLFPPGSSLFLSVTNFHSFTFSVSHSSLYNTVAIATWSPRGFISSLFNLRSDGGSHLRCVTQLAERVQSVAAGGGILST